MVSTYDKIHAFKLKLFHCLYWHKETCLPNKWSFAIKAAGGIIALPASRVIVFIFGLQEQPICVKDRSNKIFTRTRYSGTVYLALRGADPSI